MKAKETTKSTDSQQVAVAFYRISTDKQDTERQYNDVRQYCGAYNIEIVQEYAETISGAASLDKRKELQNLLKYVDDFKPKYVVVSELSRLARSQDAVSIIKSWTDKNVCFVSLKENIRTIDADGKTSAMTTLLLQIMSALNEFELSTITYRVRSGLSRTVQSGTWSGKAPYGYDIQGQKNTARLVTNSETDIVKFMFEKYADNWGTHKIASYLNSNKTYTKQGVNWVDSKVYKILNNSIYCGKRVWNDEIIEMPEAAIISDGLFAIVKERLNKNLNVTDLNKHNKYDYLLSNKIRCACGQNFIGQHRHGFYMCKSKKYKGGCDTRSIKIDFLENSIKNKLIENHAELIYDNTLILSKNSELQAELVVLEQDVQTEKRTQNNLLNNIGVLQQNVFQTKYTASQELQNKLQIKIEEIQKKLEEHKKAELVFVKAKFTLGADDKYKRQELIIEKEVLQKIIEVITIDNENVNVILTNGNTFNIKRV